MKILKIILIVLASIVVLLTITVAFMPSERMVERSILVATPANKPFKMVNELKNWTKWSPWYLMDTTSVMTYSENSAGLDSWYTWDSKNKNIGIGKLTIINSTAPDSVIVSLEFGDWDPSTAGYYFETVGENETKVTQRMPLIAQGFWGKFQIFIMENVMVGMFDKGLALIKSNAESMPDEPEIAGKIEGLAVEEMPAGMSLTFTDTTDMATLSQFLERGYGEIMVQAGMQNLEIAGPVFATYHLWDEENNIAVVECGVPVNKEGVSVGNVIYKTMEPRKALVADFFGPYDNSMKAHLAIIAHAEENQIELGDSPTEIYVNDPSTVSDPMQIHTRVSYPIK